jgi:ATP-dependent DNA ligase
VRAMAGRTKDAGGTNKLMVYSRNLRDASHDNYTLELEDLTSRWPELIFDGEVFREATPLSLISGSSRNLGLGKGKAKMEKLVCDFMIYDVYVRYAPLLPYGDRHEMYMSIAAEMKDRYTYVKFVRGLPMKGVSDWPLVEPLYKKTIERGYEGLMLKDAEAAYEPSWGGYHSAAICKMKERLSAEFQCVGWAAGEGKLARCVATWTVAIVEGSKTGVEAVDVKLQEARGKTFAVSLSATELQKKAWYKAFTESAHAFQREIRGQMATVEFFELSANGIPTQGTWVSFRDYEGRIDNVLATSSVTTLDDDE